MGKLCGGILLISILIILGMGYVFIYQGRVETSADGRTAIVLEPAERDLVLEEMRTFVASIQKITAGISEEDMQKVVTHARRSGKQATEAMPASLMGRLPLAFKKLGMDTHRRFDQLALDAEQMGDGDHALRQLSELMNNCVSCHAAYRIVTVK